MRDALLRCHRGQSREWEAEPILVAGARMTLREQKATGVTQIMSSEVFTDDFMGHLPRYLTGIGAVRSQEAAGGGGGAGSFFASPARSKRRAASGTPRRFAWTRLWTATWRKPPAPDR